MVATLILGVLVTAMANIYANVYNSIRNIRAANTVYEEARFTMERMVREIRNGTIDYEEYYNQATNYFEEAGPNVTYGQNYCQYSRQFNSAGPDGQFGTYDDESTGIRDPDSKIPIENRIQKKLYLTNLNGTRRTYLQRIETVDSQGNTIGKIALLKLEGKDYGIDHIDSDIDLGFGACPRDTGEKDGLIDTWVCEKGFNCKEKLISFSNPFCSGLVDVIIDDPADFSTSSFVDITPSTIDIVSLQFIITPQDDPYKAYADPFVQIQPHVTIKMIAKASPRIAREFKAGTPNIILESTISTRVFSEIITECNLQECINLDTSACPKTQGVCADSEQSCTQSIWPGCSDEEYEDFAAANWIDNQGAAAIYESGNEFAGCGTDITCREERCSDGVDNDCNGRIDLEDSACLFWICNNGRLDFDGDGEPLEICIDVGGVCQTIRPLETNGELPDSCLDGYDNDCNFVDGVPGTGADEFDQNCIDYFCSNGIQDPAFPNSFVKSDYNYTSKNYLLGPDIADFYENDPLDPNSLAERCIDIGGLCEFAFSGTQRLVANETEDLCYDGLDNDCDGRADELDLQINCAQAICSNSQYDFDLADSTHSTPGYLVDYKDVDNLFSTNKDEVCADTGGLCGLIGQYSLPETDPSIINGCFDDIDNDCTGGLDGNKGPNSDPFCCPDDDGDGFFSVLGEASATCSLPDKQANIDSNGLYGIADCDDTDFAIKPVTSGTLTPEVCDDAIYDDVTHPLFDGTTPGKPIDNNCSQINLVYGSRFPDDGWDHSDPACCVDVDGDGFGVQTAYIYKGTAGTYGTCTATLLDPFERTPFDCKDTAPTIHPNKREETLAECTDGLNNNCRFRDIQDLDTGKFDHIDMWASAIPPYDIAANIQEAFDNDLFDDECCDLGAIEICDDTSSLLGDGSNSDENCNGLAGLDDHYCISSAGTMFYNNLSTNLNSSYLIPAAVEFTATWDVNTGTIYLNPDTELSQVAISDNVPLSQTACGNVDTVNITHDADLPAGTDITYEVSSDGGAPGSWEAYTEGLGNDHTFLSSGSNLRWRATFTGTGAAPVPVLNTITLNYTCS